MTIQDKKELLTELLQESTEAHLADCLDMVPEEHIEAMHAFIMQQKGNRVYKAVYRFQIVQDVAALIEGKPDNAHFSKPFLSIV